MYNLTFATLADAMKVNKLNETEVVNHLKVFYSNQNYRANYNREKNAVVKALKNDPVIVERMKALKAARAK